VLLARGWNATTKPIKEKEIVMRITAFFSVLGLVLASLASAGCDQTATAPATNNPATNNPPSGTATTGDPMPAPDNTAINERDASGDTKTPIDQDENSPDIKITTQIRSRITGDSTMSLNARNVKIVTSQGKVTLRGPVDSAAEKDAIEAIARDVAGEGNVDNQIEVANR
jgi:hypothetical protein